jgi:hypothetical protein
MREKKIKIEIVPVGVAQKVLAQELKREVREEEEKREAIRIKALRS